MAVDDVIEEEPKEIKEEEGKLKPKAQPWHMVVAGVIMLFYLLWMGHIFFGTPPPTHSKRNDEIAAITWKAAQQAGPDGDLSKVNPDDRDAFLTVIRGAPVNPRSVLQGMWKAHHLSKQDQWKEFWRTHPY